ncbi:MAG: hypothetical protein LBR15_00560 [Methanobrevibacter sp.]|jgi:hypothetical protein|nr:hypothetical protein [Candidatus Methanovirga australis]
MSYSIDPIIIYKIPLKPDMLMMKPTLTGMSLSNNPRNDYELPKPDKKMLKEVRKRNKL